MDNVNNTDNKVNTFSQLITVLVSVIVVAAIGFATYLFMSPKSFKEEDTENYLPIDAQNYEDGANIENEVDLPPRNYSFSSTELQEYADYRDYYQGRDNPFNNPSVPREGIVEYEDYLEEDEVDLNKEDNRKNNNHINNDDDDEDVTGMMDGVEE